MPAMGRKQRRDHEPAFPRALYSRQEEVPFAREYVLASGARPDAAQPRSCLFCDACLFAGDSGNDMEVRISPIPAVLVANGSEEVRRVAIDGSKQKGNSGRL
jgi:hypothetical protein